MCDCAHVDITGQLCGVSPPIFKWAKLRSPDFTCQAVPLVPYPAPPQTHKAPSKAVCHAFLCTLQVESLRHSMGPGSYGDNIGGGQIYSPREIRVSESKGLVASSFWQECDTPQNPHPTPSTGASHSESHSLLPGQWWLAGGCDPILGDIPNGGTRKCSL